MYNTYSGSGSWGDRRLNPSQLNPLSMAACLDKLFDFVSKWKCYEEWKETICYILKHREDPDQFQMLRTVCQEMAKISRSTLATALDYSDDTMINCRTLGSFYLLLSYFTDTGKFRYAYTLKRVYNNLVDKCKLYEKEIDSLEGLSQNEYSPKLTDQIKVCVDMLPKFFIGMGEKLNNNCIDSLMRWIQVYPQKTREDIINLNEFCKFLVSSVSEPDPYTFQFNRDASAGLLLSIIRRCSTDYPGTDNLCLLVDHLPDIAINSIDESRDLCSLTSNIFVSCFARLTKSSLTVRTVKLLQTLSFALRRDSDFFTLKRLFKEIVLPRFVRYHKSTTASQNQLRKLVKYFLQGFLSVVVINKEELGYFFHNYALVKRKDMESWIKLACLASHGNKDLQNELNRLASKIITTPAASILTQKQYAHAYENNWEIDQKDLEERKKYELIESKMSGLVNPNSRCYIISVLQMLFMTKSIPELLKKYEREYTSKSYSFSSTLKSPLLYELRWLMTDLKEQRKSIGIDKIKQYGPAAFRLTEGQQDCHEYISALFTTMEEQFAILSPQAKKQILVDFKTVFEITIETTIICQKCRTKVLKIQQSYIHSINLKEDLAEEWVTHVAHTCDNCKTTNPNREMRKKIIKWPLVLLVHLERYSFKNDKQIKELGSSNIPRTFKNFKLMGIISHIGKNPMCGHYVLYWKKEPLIWLEFNDERVYEFHLDNEDQPFERNFRSANTPYILIYQQVGPRRQ